MNGLAPRRFARPVRLAYDAHTFEELAMPWFNREFINALPKALSRFNKFGYRRQEKFRGVLQRVGTLRLAHTALAI